MAKLKTHFPQVPLEIVKKIVEKQIEPEKALTKTVKKLDRR
jgi:hypothetical protein